MSAKQIAHLRETTSIFDEIVGNRSKVRDNSEQHLRGGFSASMVRDLSIYVDPSVARVRLERLTYESGRLKWAARCGPFFDPGAAGLDAHGAASPRTPLGASPVFQQARILNILSILGEFPEES